MNKQCKGCGEEFPETELNDYGMCEDCFSDFDGTELETQFDRIFLGICPDCED